MWLFSHVEFPASNVLSQLCRALRVHSATTKLTDIAIYVAFVKQYLGEFYNYGELQFIIRVLIKLMIFSSYLQ